jgi:predicted DNA-binding protein (MmcQ/YjbR family)
MTYNEVMKFCLSFPGAERKTLTESGNAFGLMVGTKMFGYFETGAPIHWQFSLRVTPEHFDELPSPPNVRKVTEREDDHWLTIARVDSFDGELLKELISWSYQRAQAA